MDTNGTPPADSAPVDTATIAQHAMETLEAADSPPSQPESSSPTPAQTPSGATPPTEPTPSEAELLLQEQGYVSQRKPDGRDHWIPRSKVVAMIESGLKKRAETFAKEKADFEARLKSEGEEAAQARRFRQMMEQDPRGLLARLAELDPRYKAFLEPPQAAPAAHPPAEDDPEPPPDIDLGNGRATYSLDGLRKRDAWQRRQMEKVIEERMRPVTELRERAERRQAEARVERQLEERSAAQITRAKSWPHWSEVESEVVRLLKEDSSRSEQTGQPMQLDLHSAYMQAAQPYLTGNYQKVRETVMKELNAAPRSTSVAQTGAEPTRAPAVMSTEEVARRALARLEGRT